MTICGQSDFLVCYCSPQIHFTHGMSANNSLYKINTVKDNKPDKMVEDIVLLKLTSIPQNGRLDAGGYCHKHVLLNIAIITNRHIPVITAHYYN